MAHKKSEHLSNGYWVCSAVACVTNRHGTQQLTFMGTVGITDIKIHIFCNRGTLGGPRYLDKRNVNLASILNSVPHPGAVFYTIVIYLLFTCSCEGRWTKGSKLLQYGVNMN